MRTIIDIIAEEPDVERRRRGLAGASEKYDAALARIADLERTVAALRAALAPLVANAVGPAGYCWYCGQQHTADCPVAQADMLIASNTP